jgi:DNA polymerase-3 subunit delta
MSKPTPVVYVLHGEDEYKITQFVAGMQNELGDSALSGMNITRLDGRSISFEELETAACTLPFLASHRLVVVTHPIAKMTTDPAKERFLNLLNRVPDAVRLVLVEYQALSSGNKVHWLLKWSQKAGERVLVQEFPLPKNNQMAARIQEMARAVGGQITGEAAELLASFTGENPRLADQELQKLLAYVNYSRSVDIDDVQHASIDQGSGNIFALVDAIGNRNGRQAINMLHRLLAEEDVRRMFSMIVRQFRLLILTREVIEERGGQEDVARVAHVPFFVASRLIGQARQFSLPGLEAIYHQLLEMDVADKSSEIDLEVALDGLITIVTQPGVRERS